MKFISQRVIDQKYFPIWAQNPHHRIFVLIKHAISAAQPCPAETSGMEIPPKHGFHHKPTELSKTFATLFHFNWIMFSIIINFYRQQIPGKFQILTQANKQAPAAMRAFSRFLFFFSSLFTKAAVYLPFMKGHQKAFPFYFFCSASACLFLQVVSIDWVTYLPTSIGHLTNQRKRLICTFAMKR